MEANEQNKGMFRNPFSFEGRIRRTEYWISAIIIGVLSLITEFMIASESGVLIFIAIVLYIGIAWFSLAQGAKRCHDRGNSGWYQIIPLYGLWMAFGDSEYGTNEYGDCPK